MKKLSILTIFLFPITSFAVPNMWSSGFGQGVTEYLITNQQNATFNLNCTTNPDAQNVLQHSVLIDLPDGNRADSRDEQTSITVVMDDQQFPIPASLGWRNGDNAWISFIDALGNTAAFDVYVNDKKVGSFTPGTGNTRKVLNELSGCRNTAG